MTSQLPSFWCLFLSYQLQKNTEKWAAVTSLRPFLFRDDFNVILLHTELAIRQSSGSGQVIIRKSIVKQLLSSLQVNGQSMGSQRL